MCLYSFSLSFIQVYLNFLLYNVHAVSRIFEIKIKLKIIFKIETKVLKLHSKCTGRFKGVWSLFKLKISKYLNLYRYTICISRWIKWSIYKTKFYSRARNVREVCDSLVFANFSCREPVLKCLWYIILHIKNILISRRKPVYLQSIVK